LSERSWWRRRKEPREETLGESLRTFALALALALVIRTLLLQTFYVPSGSMFQTLLLGDHVFVNKVLYGIRIPRWWCSRRRVGHRVAWSRRIGAASCPARTSSSGSWPSPATSSSCARAAST
jgi:signal peptidase I